MEKFSVLMSVYKNEKAEYLDKAIESILNQTILPDEIVIVKDGILTSDLECVLSKYASQYSFFKFLEFSKNRGLGLALRDGILACSNELIARMDTDDIAKPERFEKQLEYLRTHPEISLLGSCIEEFSNDVYKSDSVTILPLKYDEIVKFAKKRNPFRHMTVIFKRSAVVNSGNYRDFLWFEDYDLWMRMMKTGYRMENLRDVLVSVRAADDMFSRRGGYKYFKQEYKFQKYLLELKIINTMEFYFNIIVRGTVRFIPNIFRAKVYRNFLRN
ncbi:glycosyltransferase [uncultured Phascolarctobacterium sp.]|uniref:glycosyltransferase n=1 Tax=uncultured Phascolarctobacterium sp. TaxID=512296 RepID=UPI0025CDAB87|nr:glycosyltransferase [uncultured Phascolarctobacterium sp.]